MKIYYIESNNGTQIIGGNFSIIGNGNISNGDESPITVIDNCDSVISCCSDFVANGDTINKVQKYSFITETFDKLTFSQRARVIQLIAKLLKENNE